MCRYPKEWVCWSAGHNEQMAFKQAGLLGRGGEGTPSVHPGGGGPLASVQQQESAARGGRETGTLDARPRLCYDPGGCPSLSPNPRK